MIGIKEYYKTSTTSSLNNCISQLDYDSDIVFFGDSITQFMDFQSSFPDKKCVNLGVSGDNLSSMIHRCYTISSTSPDKIFVEGGVNSLDDLSVKQASALYLELITQIIDENPDSEIYLQSILPISKSSQSRKLTNQHIIDMNEQIKNIADNYNLTYIDIYSLYVKDGEMYPEYTKDGVHLKDEYMYIWADELYNYIY